MPKSDEHRVVDRQLTLAFEASSQCLARHQRHDVVEEFGRPFDFAALRAASLRVIQARCA
jgi:hypothetical protein